MKSPQFSFNNFAQITRAKNVNMIDVSYCYQVCDTEPSNAGKSNLHPLMNLNNFMWMIKLSRMSVVKYYIQT